MKQPRRKEERIRKEKNFQSEKAALKKDILSHKKASILSADFENFQIE